MSLRMGAPPLAVGVPASSAPRGVSVKCSSSSDPSSRAADGDTPRGYSPSLPPVVDLEKTDPPPSEPVESGAATLRLMLIEDDRTYAWLVEEMLVEAFSGETLDVISFGSLAAATEETRLVDCALVDLSLPDASGLGVVDSVLVTMPEVPVVVLTGAEDEQLALQAVERGAQDYLVKRRVDPEVLGRSVRYAIERKRGELQRGELLRARAAHAEAEALSGMLSRLQEVADAAIAVHGRLDRSELLERSLSVIAADAGALIMQPSGGAPPTVAAVRGLDGISTSTRVEETGVTAIVLDTDSPLVIGRMPPEDSSTLGTRAGVCSLVAVPLEADGRRLGALVATSPLAGRF